MRIDDVALAVWAKTDRDTAGWLSLPQHLLDSAETAAFVWDDFLPRPVRKHITSAVGGCDAARDLVTFLAGVHDVGKASPAFQIQGPPELVEACRGVGLTIDPRIAPRRTKMRHELAGQIALERWLVGMYGFDLDPARSFACVIGGHHGVFPDADQLRIGRDDHDLLGTGLWVDVREHLFDQMAETSGVAGRLAVWSRMTLPATTQALLCGVVIISDWVASNPDLFDLENSVAARANRARAAWEALDLPAPWQANDEGHDVNGLLLSRFDLPVAARARPIQRAALEVVDGTDAPGLFIIEAPMGVGKTEAALMLAERLATRLGLGGLIFALPSMATSDAIFTRARRWVEQLPAADSSRRASMFIAHSKSSLNDEYQAIRWRGVAGINEDGQVGHAVAVAHEWLAGRKKGVLSSFVVGTIDQVLFAALKSKHLVLRHLALAGKVVIIDEVHAADEYMAVYLDRTLEWLGAYGVPTILLSATLPGERRRAMALAYDTGRGTYTPPSHRRRRRGEPPIETVTPYDTLATHTGYPLITATTSGAPTMEVVADDGVESAMHVSCLPDDDASLHRLLADRLADGGCAVVIRNTVSRAQQTYLKLRPVFGNDVSLMHSRFVATDRRQRELELLRMFGPPGSIVERPTRHVVVATQVVEQSLDVDFDLMISDVAPIDLLLQRSGRLHRHHRDQRPVSVGEPRMFVTGADWSADVPIPDEGAVAVYGADALLRSLAVLDLPTEPIVRVPSDVPRLVQTAYAEDCPTPAGWEAAMAEARKAALDDQDRRTSAAGVYVLGPPGRSDLVGWTSGVSGDLTSEARGHAAVRDGQESLEVIVVQRRADGQIYRWGAADEATPVPIDFEPDLRLARRISADTLRLAPAMTAPWRIDRTITALERNRFEGWQASRWLREQLVLVLDENCRCVLAGFNITYDDELGLVVTRERDIDD